MLLRPLTRAAFLFLFSSCCALAATTPDELVAEVEAAIKARDGAAFQKCFNLEGAGPGAEKAMQKTIDKVFSWPSHYVYTSERVDTGPAHAVRDGVAYTLNGEWMFNLSMDERPSKGLVFPAGFANGKCLILVAVKEDKK